MADFSETQVKRTMIANANIVFALLDHSKFTNNNDFVKLCDLQYLNYLITDRPVSEINILNALKENHVNIIYKRVIPNLYN